MPREHHGTIGTGCRAGTYVGAVRTTTAEPLHRGAGPEDGVAAVPVGIAGNRSSATGVPVAVADPDLR